MTAGGQVLQRIFLFKDMFISILNESHAFRVSLTFRMFNIKPIPCSVFSADGTFAPSLKEN